MEAGDLADAETGKTGVYLMSVFRRVIQTLHNSCMTHRNLMRIGMMVPQLINT
jgi:hypothetical protein